MEYIKKTVRENDKGWIKGYYTKLNHNILSSCLAKVLLSDLSLSPFLVISLLLKRVLAETFHLSY